MIYEKIIIWSHIIRSQIGSQIGLDKKHLTNAYPVITID